MIRALFIVAVGFIVGLAVTSKKVLRPEENTIIPDGNGANHPYGYNDQNS
jgi:hypothetical protein